MQENFNNLSFNELLDEYEFRENLLKKAKDSFESAGIKKDINKIFKQLSKFRFKLKCAK
mgnify:CR=1 FL=1